MSEHTDAQQSDHKENEVIPSQVFPLFQEWVHAGMLPSIALRKLTQQFPSPHYDPSAIIYMLKTVYPDADIQHAGFRFRIWDANYLHSDFAEFSDADFDAGIAKMDRARKNPLKKSTIN